MREINSASGSNARGSNARVTDFVVKLWWQSLVAGPCMVRAKCGRLPHFDHTPPHTHHKVWRKCGGRGDRINTVKNMVRVWWATEDPPAWFVGRVVRSRVVPASIEVYYEPPDTASAHQLRINTSIIELLPVAKTGLNKIN